MIPDEWRRIAGVYVCADGDVGVVWLAHDTDRDFVRLYDACLFRREVPAVIVEGLNARGRYIPVAWANKEFSDLLLDRGVLMLPEPISDSDAAAKLSALEIWERTRTGRFKFTRALKDWGEEYLTYNLESQKIPRDSHPLMGATRYALQVLPYARKPVARGAKRPSYPKVAMI